MSADDFILAVAELWLRWSNRRLVRHYRRRFHRGPAMACPDRYSDRMLWRKTVDRNPDFVMFSDKLAAKDFIRRVCPDLPVPKTLWVGTDATAIPEELLRRDVFVKANHGSGFNHRLSGGPVDRAALAKMTAQWLATAYGKRGREWSYLKVPRQIFVEETIRTEAGELLEFNIRASNGRPLLGSVMGRVKTPEQWYFYLDVEGRATWGMDDLPDEGIKPLPSGLDIAEPYRRAVEYTRRLSAGIDYARHDFFWNGEQLFGGEITLFPAAGNDDPTNPYTDRLVREGWDLLQAHFLRTPQRGLKRLYAEALRRRLEARRGPSGKMPAGAACADREEILQ